MTLKKLLTPLLLAGLATAALAATGHDAQAAAMPAASAAITQAAGPQELTPVGWYWRHHHRYWRGHHYHH
jgi:hypothetical protein